MAEEKLLPELIAEILSRVPPKSLARFRIVSQKWNALFDDKNFINNHKATFRFILTTKSKIYSVSINPKIVVLELTLDVPELQPQIPQLVLDCNECLLCGMNNGAVVWNPWLKQSRWIKKDSNQTGMLICDVGHNIEGNYKIVVSCYRKEDLTKRLIDIYDSASDTWNNHKLQSGGSQNMKMFKVHSVKGASLNGNFYWIAFYDKTDLVYHITKFNPSTERFFGFCDLPCGATGFNKDALVLSVFEGDRFSLLKQCHETKKIETWVSKNKINSNVDDEDVEWVKFIQVSVSNAVQTKKKLHRYSERNKAQCPSLLSSAKVLCSDQDKLN